MPFVKGKPYQTRNGHPARFLEADGKYGSFEVQMSGMNNSKLGWYRVLRNADGTYYDTHDPSDKDIIPITASDEELAIMQRMARSDHDELVLLIRELSNR